MICKNFGRFFASDVMNQKFRGGERRPGFSKHIVFLSNANDDRTSISCCHMSLDYDLHFLATLSVFSCEVCFLTKV